MFVIVNLVMCAVCCYVIDKILLVLYILGKGGIMYHEDEDDIRKEEKGQKPRSPLVEAFEDLKENVCKLKKRVLELEERVRWIEQGTL